MITENPLGYEKPGKLLGKFAIPSIIAMLVSSLYNIVDQIFIGQGVGYIGNGATNVAFPLTTICMSISLMIGIGAAAKFSLELGKGNPKEAAGCVGNAFWMAAVLGITYAVLVEIFAKPMLNLFGATAENLSYAMDYVRITAIGMPFLIYINVLSNLIRADGNPNYSMICLVAGAVVNTVLDPVFIFGLDMGVKGAALATVISQVVSFSLSIAYMWRFKRVKIGREFLHPKISKCVRMSSLGMSNCLTQLALTVMQIVMNNSLKHYGALSRFGEDIPLSSFGIISKINAIFISVFVGIAQGAQPIVGFNYGAKKFDRVKEIYKLEIISSTVIAVIGFIVIQCFPKQLISLFGSGDELYMEFAVRFMRIFLFMIIVNGVQLISSNFFSAIGKPLKGVILALSRQSLFLVPLIIILPIFLGVEGIAFSGPVSDILAFTISVAVIARELHKMK